MDKYRVVIRKIRGAWWLKLQELCTTDDSPGWFIVWDTTPCQWRLTPSLEDGWFILPSFWFKPFAERIRIAVGYAVAAVKSIAERNKDDATVQQWTEFAQRSFDDAMAKVE